MMLLLIGWLLVGLLLVLLGILSFGGFYTLVFYIVFGFYPALMFFGFSGGFDFWNFGCFFDDFLIFLRFFFGAFELILLTKMGTIFKILLQFIFFGVYWLALMRGCCKHHRVEFTALRLVFNRICIGVCIYARKYKKV